MLIIKGYGNEWTEFYNIDDPDFGGDWELVENMELICDQPLAIEAQRMDIVNSDPQVVHIEAETGFWCINAEQDGVQCQDWQVRFCCRKYVSAECPEGSLWSAWKNTDSPRNGHLLGGDPKGPTTT